MSRSDFIANALASDTDDCLIWPFAVRKSSGYGAYNLSRQQGKQNVDAHRYVCAQAHGEPPHGTEAAHSCNSKLCINPRHLSWKTPIANMADAIAAKTLRGGGRFRQRLFEPDIAYIRDSAKSLLALSREYNMEPAYIGKVRRTALKAAA